MKVKASMSDLPPDQTTKQNEGRMAGTVGTLRVFGVPIRLHFTFVLLLVFLISIGLGGKQSGAATAVYILALFASVLLHEIGHVLVARWYGIGTREIVMFPIGGVSPLGNRPKTGPETVIVPPRPLLT